MQSHDQLTANPSKTYPKKVATVDDEGYHPPHQEAALHKASAWYPQSIIEPEENHRIRQKCDSLQIYYTADAAEEQNGRQPQITTVARREKHLKHGTRISSAEKVDQSTKKAIKA